MEVAFIKADSRNLPRVSVDMVITFFVQSAEFLSVEMKGTKLLRYVKIVVVKLRILFSGFYKSYGDNAIGYVQIKRDGKLCTVKGRVLRSIKLNQEIKGGAWCPRSQITTESTEWLEVDLRNVHVVTAVGTQGRFGNSEGREFAEAYVLEYWRPKLAKWVRYRTADGQENLSGNTNTYLEKKNHLEPPIWASRVRFIPYSAHRRTVCMRVEVYGCPWTEGIVSYSMPRGHKRSNGAELSDAWYDGSWGEWLRGGLGQLVDGRFGGDDIREAARQPAWVGWRADSPSEPDSPDSTQPEITFEFDKVREFSAVHIHCNNRFMRDVQVFSEAIISFSVGGQHYQEDAIHYTPEPDHIFESSRNVSIKLHHRIGRWVRIQLRFAARWILISEVVFDSDVAQGNYSAESLKPLGKDRTKAPTSKEAPVSTARQEDPLYLAIVVGVLTALVILLLVAVSLAVHRHRHRKCFASPLARHEPRPAPDKPEVKCDDYQEPYQPLKCAPYFGYSTVLLEMKDFVKDSNTALSDSSNYEYAVPEVSSEPLLSRRAGSEPPPPPPADSLGRCSAPGAVRAAPQPPPPPPRSASQQEAVSELQRRLQTASVAEFPRHRLRMISKLAEGAFGTVYVAEADGVPEYDGTVTAEKRLVAVKFLCHDATAKERNILIGKGYQIKISDFGTDNEAYAGDYYRAGGETLPLRWAAWESVLRARYSTRSDVWAFAVTLHEIYTYCRRRPYEPMTHAEVLENLSHLEAEDGEFRPLERAATCPRDVYDAMAACWQRSERDRPRFVDLHTFLMRRECRLDLDHDPR
ncbi:hypothetical protein evm_004621 [Chilo suppressalis]|nr:hypothetical protein evm_004621 [Chilo suppressalis]